jgi:hypothetical protein
MLIYTYTQHEVWSATNAVVSQSNAWYTQTVQTDSQSDVEQMQKRQKQEPSKAKSSDVPAQLGLKAMALAWLSMARAFKICRPGQSRQ